MEIDAARRGVEEKAQQLAAASQYKSEFLANMSHELRTPLNSLLLLSRLLADNPDENLTDRQIEFASTIHNAGSDLLRLIDDILDLSKIEAGRVDVEPAPVDLAEVRGFVERAFGPQAEHKGLELRVEAAPGLPDEIVTDGRRLQQILRNLLSNAMKFTAHGSVALIMAPAAARRARAGGRRAAHGRVHRARHRHRHRARQARDDLRGVPAGRRHHQPQVRRHGPGPVDQPGAGPAARRGDHGVVAARRGLRVHAVPAADAAQRRRPRPLRPATRRPRPSRRRPPSAAAADRSAAAAPRAAAATRPAAPGRPALAGTTVLIVDDDVRNVFALTSALELHGLRVLYADNGADGIALLTRHPEVDIVLMDAMMPDLDGNETTRLIRAPARGGGPAGGVPHGEGHAGRPRVEPGRGRPDYVTKPVDLDELLVTIASWVGPRGRSGRRPGGRGRRR